MLQLVHPLMDRNRRRIQRRNLRVGQGIRPLRRFCQVERGIPDGGFDAVGLQPQNDVVNAEALLSDIAVVILIAARLHRRQHRVNLLARRVALDVRCHGLPRQIQPLRAGVLRKRHCIVHKIQLHRNVHIVVRDALHRLLKIERHRLQILAVKRRHLKIKLSKRDMRKSKPQHMVLYRLAQPRIILLLKLLHSLLNHPLRVCDNRRKRN